MKIGALAQQSGVTASTIRFYEHKGLLTSQRQSNGYRSYTAQSLQQLQLIKFSQSLGFSLDEMPKLMNADDTLDHPAILARLEIKRQEAHALLAQVQHQSQRLDNLINLLHENWSKGQCLPAQTLTELLNEANY